tara:strand:+ start:11571 stop:11993 length:423 start_codon:yes stop_codon:yes gene_type:complete
MDKQHCFLCGNEGLVGVSTLSQSGLTFIYGLCRCTCSKGDLYSKNFGKLDEVVRDWIKVSDKHVEIIQALKEEAEKPDQISDLMRRSRLMRMKRESQYFNRMISIGEALGLLPPKALPLIPLPILPPLPNVKTRLRRTVK